MSYQSCLRCKRSFIPHCDEYSAHCYKCRTYIKKVEMWGALAVVAIFLSAVYVLTHLNLVWNL